MFKTKTNGMLFKIMMLATFLYSSVVTAQGVVEIRDPLRGVSYYSIELSNDPISELQFVDNYMAGNDEITTGISALYFDESKTVNEYILWFHHNGDRKWLSASFDNTLTVSTGDRYKEIDYLHITTSGGSDESGFSEKVEFRLTAEEFLSILDSDNVSFELSTALGTVIKPLGQEEITALLKFDAKVRKLHSESHVLHRTSLGIQGEEFDNIN